MRSAGLVFTAVLTLLWAFSGAAQATFPGKNGRIAFAGPSGIHTVNADGSGRVLIGSGRYPRWSPDGTKIAFATGGDLAVMDADGSNRHVIVDAGPESVNGITWSPDGGKLAYTERICDTSGCNGSLFTVNADGSDVTFVPSRIFNPADPDWSPDGSKLALWEQWEGPQNIYTVNPDGTGRRQLTLGNEGARGSGEPSWSPDAQRLLFTLTATGTLPVLRTMNANGSSQATIPGSQGAHSPARWSPDGRRIVFSRFAEDNRLELWTTNPDGSGATLVYSDGFEWAQNPDWQPEPVNGYPRAKAASPIEVTLVPAYQPCTAPNRTHGPPLAFGSCGPPAVSSDEATFGTPDSNGRPVKGHGRVRYVAFGADVRMTFELHDVYNSSSLTDYSGDLRLRSTLRITDKRNTPHPGGPGAATVSDTTLAANVPCVATADTTTGASCELNTTAGALVPGIVTPGARTVWELGQVQVEDGGADGVGTTTGDNTLFATQGVFVP